MSLVCCRLNVVVVVVVVVVFVFSSGFWIDGVWLSLGIQC